MKAVILDGHGGPEVLTVADVPDPTAGPEDVLIKVHSSALNRADLLQRMGLYPVPPGASAVPGMEFAGTVMATGCAAHQWKAGGEVMGITSGGAYAEQVVVNQRQLMAVPSSVPLADASAIPEVFLTAFDALVPQGGLTSGRWALVHAGASGVGTAAIQICKAIGANVIVTASAGKVQRCLDLGADRAVDYKTEDFAEAVQEVTGGRGVDVVLCVIGGQYTIRNIQSLRVGGRLVQVGVMGEGKVELPLGMLLPKRASIIGTVLRSRPLEEKAALTQRVAAELLPLFETGKLQPVIDSRFPVEQISDAHAYMETNANVGKILIDL